MKDGACWESHRRVDESQYHFDGGSCSDLGLFIACSAFKGGWV